jgi:heptosyltransferase-2
MARALLIKFGAIGDVIMAIPAAHQLHLAGYTIDWLCGSAVAPVLATYDWINPIVADDRAILLGSSMTKLKALAAIWRALPSLSYDLCATLYYDPRYKLLALPIRAPRKLMLSTTDRATRLLPGRHHTDEFARILLGRPDGVQPTSLPPIRPDRMPPSPVARTSPNPQILLAPAGARNMLRDDALRRWPPELYVELARTLLARNCDITLIGGPDDTWATPLFAGLPVHNLIGALTLLETIALLDQSDVLVTHDTGPLHLAGLTAIGIVAIFGPTDPRGRLPQRANTVALWGGEGFACRPCYDGHQYAPCTDNACMRQVSPQMVAGQVLAVLNQKAASPRPPRVLTPESTVKA